MRERFDKTREEKDMRKLAAMVEEGEEELFRNQHFQPFLWKVINSAMRSSKRQCIKSFFYTAKKAVSTFIVSFYNLERSWWYSLSALSFG